MVTNKRKKRLRRLFVVFIGLLILSFYLLYRSFVESYDNNIYAAFSTLEDLYPNLKVSKELFIASFDFNFQWYFYFALIGMLLIIIYIYYTITHSYQTYSKDVAHIIQEIDRNEFVASSLEGELSLLEEKIYSYKIRNDVLQEKSDREKKELSDYIENIAHQLKTPITSIRLNEEMAFLAEDLSVLENNKSSFERLDSLFDSFMKLARLEKESIQFQLELSTINSLLDAVGEACQPILKNVELIRNDCDFSFYYDEQWLVEAFYNIIKNCVEENVSKISIDAYVNNEMVHILIKDNGKGIDSQDLPYIFNRFYRSSKNKKKGVGIGLALTKEIVDRHHGFINAYNDDGAVFDLSFPILDIKEKVI